MNVVFNAFSKILAIVGKDVITELRTKETVSAMFIFSMWVIFIFNFTFDLRAENVTILAPGVLWVTIAFTSMLGLGRSFIIEKDRGSLEGLLLTPVDRSVIYLGKFVSNVLFISLVAIMVLPLFIIFFDQPLEVMPYLVGIIILGIVGLAGVGTLFSAMVIHTRARDTLLPILLFPIVVPILLAVVRLTTGVLDNKPSNDLSQWLGFAVAFDMIFMAISFVLFEYVVEE